MLEIKVVEMDGIKVRFRECERGIIDEVFVENPYRIEEIPLGSTVVDVGAHIGTVTLRCAVERGCQVYAYEPSDGTFALLVENVGLNGLEDRVSCFNQAIGGCREMRNFYVEETQGSSSLYLGENPDFADLPLKAERIQCTTLKHIFEENSLEHCDFLKMDCEGAEREVFNEEAEPYFRRVGRVVLEWHNYDGEKYAEYLRRLGFSVRLTGTGERADVYVPGYERGMLYAKAGELGSGGIE